MGGMDFQTLRLGGGALNEFIQLMSIVSEIRPEVVAGVFKFRPNNWGNSVIIYEEILFCPCFLP